MSNVIDFKAFKESKLTFDKLKKLENENNVNSLLMDIEKFVENSVGQRKLICQTFLDSLLELNKLDNGFNVQRYFNYSLFSSNVFKLIFTDNEKCILKNISMEISQQYDLNDEFINEFEIYASLSDEVSEHDISPIIRITTSLKKEISKNDSLDEFNLNPHILNYTKQWKFQPFVGYQYLELFNEIIKQFIKKGFLFVGMGLIPITKLYDFNRKCYSFEANNEILKDSKISVLLENDDLTIFIDLNWESNVEFFTDYFYEELNSAIEENEEMNKNKFLSEFISKRKTLDVVYNPYLPEPEN